MNEGKIIQFPGSDPEKNPRPDIKKLTRLLKSLTALRPHLSSLKRAESAAALKLEGDTNAALVERPNQSSELDWTARPHYFSVLVEELRRRDLVPTWKRYLPNKDDE